MQLKGALSEIQYLLHPLIDGIMFICLWFFDNSQKLLPESICNFSCYSFNICISFKRKYTFQFRALKETKKMQYWDCGLFLSTQAFSIYMTLRGAGGGGSTSSKHVW